MLSSMFKMAKITAMSFTNVHVRYKGERKAMSPSLFLSQNIASHTMKCRGLSNATHSNVSSKTCSKENSINAFRSIVKHLHQL